jgi:hypothetical protein
MDGEDQDQGLSVGILSAPTGQSQAHRTWGIKHNPFDTPEPASFHEWRPTTRG